MASRVLGNASKAHPKKCFSTFFHALMSNRGRYKIGSESIKFKRYMLSSFEEHILCLEFYFGLFIRGPKYLERMYFEL
jgi:hypothetical protein